MESVLLIVHVIIALGIVGLIMLQQGKGAEMGASFGAGASQTVFGAAGSSNLFSKMTALLVTAFFITSIVLAILSKESIEASDVQVPGVEAVLPEDVSVEVSGNDDDIPEALPEAESFEPQALEEVEELPEAAEEAETIELEAVEEAPAD